MDLIEARSIFTPATGFIRRGGFDWTCNPYLGCTFGCSYCYAAFLPQNRRPISEWGRWLSAKQNAVAVAVRQAPKVAGQSIYLSSVTDPYLPAERTLRLTRGLLEILIAHQPRLVIQTRGPMVLRDIDLLTQFPFLRVNLSLPTDNDDIRKVFEPKAPPLESRWQAAEELKAAGVAVGICVTPTLPLRDPELFAARLARFEPSVLVIQEFHAAQGRFGADTGPAAIEAANRMNWTTDSYRYFRSILAARYPIHEGEAGFFPPPRSVS